MINASGYLVIRKWNGWRGLPAFLAVWYFDLLAALKKR
jgi:hypothetical protein